jgi:hypothetical protein
VRACVSQCVWLAVRRQGARSEMRKFSEPVAQGGLLDAMSTFRFSSSCMLWRLATAGAPTKMAGAGYGGGVGRFDRL